MKKKFKLMLAMEDEAGKGILTPLVQGSVDLSYDPEANNSQAMKAVSESICEELNKLDPNQVLMLVNKLMIG